MAVTEIETALNSNWDTEPPRARLLARLAHGCLGWAISVAADDGLLRQRADKLDRLLDIIKADYEERFAYAAQLATQFSQNRGLVQEILGLWLNWWRDLLLVKVDVNDIITNVDRLATLIEMAMGYNLAQIKTFIHSVQAAGEQLRQNANPRLVLEGLMLSIPERSSFAEEIPLPSLR